MCLNALIVLRQSEMAVGCGQSHPLNSFRPDVLYSVFRELVTNHQACVQIYHAKSDWLLVGHCFPLRQFPCPDFFWYLCHGHCWNLSYEGLHDLPQPEGEFSEKGTSQHVDGKGDLFGLMHWGHLCKGRDSSKGTVCRSGKASCQECADLRSPTGAWVEALKCNTMLIISRY